MKNWTKDFIQHVEGHIQENTMVSYGDCASIMEFIEKYLTLRQFIVTEDKNLRKTTLTAYPEQEK